MCLDSKVKYLIKDLFTNYGETYTIDDTAYILRLSIDNSMPGEGCFSRLSIHFDNITMYSHPWKLDTFIQTCNYEHLKNIDPTENSETSARTLHYATYEVINEITPRKSSNDSVDFHESRELYEELIEKIYELKKIKR